MLNIKNIFIISFSAILAAIITGTIFLPALSLQSLSSLFVCAIISGLVTLIIQSFTANPGKVAPKSNKTNKTKAKAKAKAKKASSNITSDHEEGTVKWFDSKKGYGFITRAMGEDIFVHFRSIQGNGYRSLQEGQAVKFLVTTGDKGPQAEDIHVI